MHAENLLEVRGMNGPHAKHLKDLKGFLADPEICRDSLNLLVHLATRLAAAGHGAKVLTMVERSPEAALLKPLADGLKMHLGKKLQVAGAEFEQARQMAERIDEEVAVA